MKKIIGILKSAGKVKKSLFAFHLHFFGPFSYWTLPRTNSRFHFCSQPTPPKSSQQAALPVSTYGMLEHVGDDALECKVQ